MKLDNGFLERKSLGQDVFEYLKKTIINQTIAPGSRLVESKIASMLGISRTPLREALHKLEREDWIEKLPSGGYQVVTMTKDDIEQTFGIRIVLEAYAARLATEKCRPEDLVPLEEKMKEYLWCLENQKDYEKLHEINTEFHDLLYSLSQNPKLIKIINQLQSRISIFRQIILKNTKNAYQSYEDHMNMLAAIKNRDGDAVDQLVSDHIKKGKDAVLTVKL